MAEFLTALATYGFLQSALIAGLLASVGCGVIGPFVVVDCGAVYLQITRGVAPRAHAWRPSLLPTLVVSARRHPVPDRERLLMGIRVVTLPDLRWRRADIKSVSLLPNVLGKQAAMAAGADEAWLVADDGTVTEGTSSNAWIVTAAGDVVTREAGTAILNGITRQAVLHLAAERGFAFRERPFTVAEAKGAREAFATSTTALVRPVVGIDDAVVGDGTPGPLTRQVMDLYLAHFRGTNR